MSGGPQPKPRPISPGHYKYLVRQIERIRAQGGDDDAVDGFLRVESDAPFSQLPDVEPDATETPGMLRGLSMAALQGATFGFADEAVEKLFSSIEAGQEFRNELAAFRAANGGTAALAEVGGSLLTAGPLARAVGWIGRGGRAASVVQGGPGIMQRVAAGAGQGAVAGALSGAGNADEGDRVGGAEFGGAAGAAVGGALPAAARVVGAVVRPAVRATKSAFLQRISGAGTPEQHAREGLARALTADGLTLREALRRVDDMARTGAPISLAEVAGPNTAHFLRDALTHSSPQTQQFFEAMLERQAGQGERLTGEMLRMTLGKNRFGLRNAYDLEEMLMTAREKLATPKYRAAFEKTVPVTPELERLLKNKLLRNAYREGRKIAMEEDFDGVGHGLKVPALPSGKYEQQLRDFMKQYGLPRDKAIAGLAQAGILPESFPAEVPVRALDYMKRGLDVLLDRLDKSGRGPDRQLRRAFRKRLESALQLADEAVPEYKAARSTWSDFTSASEAVEAGRDFFRKPPQIVARELRDLSPVEREFYRVGAAQRLYDNVTGAAGERSDVAQRFFGGSLFGKRSADADRIRALFFDNPKQAEDFLDRVAVEARISHTTRGLRAPSGGTKAAEEAIEGSVPVVRATPGVAVVAAGARALTRAKSRFFEESGDELAKLVLKSDPTSLKLLLQQTLGRTRAGLERKAGVESRAAITAGATLGGMER